MYKLACAICATICKYIKAIFIHYKHTLIYIISTLKNKGPKEENQNVQIL